MKQSDLDPVFNKARLKVTEARGSHVIASAPFVRSDYKKRRLIGAFDNLDPRHCRQKKRKEKRIKPTGVILGPYNPSILAIIKPRLNI